MPVERVLFVGKHAAESNMPWPDWAVISITDFDGYGTADIKKGWHSILRVAFHDVDPARTSDEPDVEMTADHARQIVEFVRNLPTDVKGVMVHCQAGVSRSAAVAKWIAGEFRIPFDGRYDRYNRHVYKLLVEVGKAKKTQNVSAFAVSAVLKIGN